MSFVCDNSFTPIPKDCRDGNDWVLMTGCFFSTRSQQFDSKADAGDDDVWKAAVVAQTLLPIHEILEVEPLTEDTPIYQSASQGLKKLFDSKTRFRISFNMTADQYKALLSLDSKALNMYWYGANNNIAGTSPDDTIFKGYTVSFLNVEDLPIPSAEAPVLAKLDIQLAYPSERKDALAVVNPTKGTAADKWYPYNIEGLTTVTVTQVGTVSGNEAVVDIAYKSTSETNNDGDSITDAAYSGLVAANFTCTDGASPVVPTGVTESATVAGRYTLAFTAFTGGTTQITASVDHLVISASTALV